MKVVDPLVSIIVITYNSAQFVLETLESAKVQTYQNIELIVSDDCSKDNTVEICSNWIEMNKDRFVETKLIKSEKNTGIAPNCNRGLYASKGIWLNFIAGDDKIYENRIQRCVNTIRENPSIEILFSGVARNGQFAVNTPIEDPFFSLPQKQQFIELLKGNILPAAAAFINRETAIKLKGFNEKYTHLEDYPFFLKALKNGIKLYNINEQLVFYRISQNNISRQKKMNDSYQMSIKLFFKDTILKELWNNKLYLYFAHFLIDYILLIFCTKNIIKNRRTYDYFLDWLSALRWRNRIKRRLFQRL